MIESNRPDTLEAMIAEDQTPDLNDWRKKGFTIGRVKRNNYLSRLIGSKRWHGINQSHKHVGNDTYPIFSFNYLTYDERPEVSPLVESACVDMVGYLGYMCLQGCLPAEVTLTTRYYVNGESAADSENITDLALPIFQEFSDIAGQT